MAPAACTASEWKSDFLVAADRGNLAIGWMVPISLLAIMIVTRMVSGRIAWRTASGSTRPSAVDIEVGDAKPLFFQGFAGMQNRMMLDLAR